MKIAYADDNPECLRAFEAALEIYGKQYDVSFFSYASAEELLSDLKKTTFDAIFTDIEMQKMNGIEMMKELHRNRYDIPVIFITSHTKYVYQSFGINVLGYITKQKLDEELPVILQKIQAEIQHRRMIPFSSGSETVMIREEDILYIDSSQEKTKFFHNFFYDNNNDKFYNTKFILNDDIKKFLNMKDNFYIRKIWKKNKLEFFSYYLFDINEKYYIYILKNISEMQFIQI